MKIIAPFFAFAGQFEFALQHRCGPFSSSQGQAVENTGVMNHLLGAFGQAFESLFRELVEEFREQPHFGTCFVQSNASAICCTRRCRDVRFVLNRRR